MKIWKVALAVGAGLLALGAASAKGLSGQTRSTPGGKPVRLGSGLVMKWTGNYWTLYDRATMTAQLRLSEAAAALVAQIVIVGSTLVLTYKTGQTREFPLRNGTEQVAPPTMK